MAQEKIVRNLDIESFVPEDITDVNSDNIMDVIDIIIMKYRSHPSILKIKDNVIISNIFEFNNVTSEEIEKEIKQLNPKKACVGNDIPTKVLVGTNGIVRQHLSNIYNTSKNDQKYPLSLKFADVTPIHKAEEKILLKNYRPVSLIPIVSKLFERKMFDQISSYIENFLSPYHCGYRNILSNSVL